MSRPDDLVEGTRAVLESITEHLNGGSLTVATAESLTAGQITTHLGAASGSGQWLAGGVIAYSAEVKYGVLGVDRGPPRDVDTASRPASDEPLRSAPEYWPPGTVFLGIPRSSGLVSPRSSGAAGAILRKARKP